MSNLPKSQDGSTVVTDFSKGTNNIAHPERLPAGFVRSMVNMDVVPGGRATLRDEPQRAYQGTAPRAVLSLGNKLLIADGTDLVELNTSTGATRVLRQIAGSGYMVGSVLNNRLYFCTVDEALEYDGTSVRRWGVQDGVNNFTCTEVAGGLQTGYYKIAVTYTDADGREGGTSAPLIYHSDSGFKLTLPAPPAGGKTNLYVGSVNGATLYLQTSVTASSEFVVNLMRDDTAALTTAMMYAPTPGSIVCAHNGVLAIARGNVLEHTMPLRPHLVDRARAFFQYPDIIGAVVSAGGLFVSADKQYVLVGVETSDVVQKVVLEYPAIPGTAVQLPDGTASWSTMRGQVMLKDAQATSVTEAYFVPAPAAKGAAGVVDKQGSASIIVSTTSTGPNRLAAADFFDAEIKLP